MVFFGAAHFQVFNQLLIKIKPSIHFTDSHFLKEKKQIMRKIAHENESIANKQLHEL